MSSLVQSDYFVQLVALGTVIFMGILTYIFGYKSKSIDDDDIFSKVESKETKKQKVERAKKAEEKPKKKGKAEPKVREKVVEKIETPTPPQETPKQTLKNAPKKAETKKVTSPKVTTKKQEIKPVPVKMEEIPAEEDGWTKVTDKKQKKDKLVPKSAKKMEEKIPVIQDDKEIIELPVVVTKKITSKEEDSWTTVTDKKNKEKKSVSPPVVVERSSSENSTSAAEPTMTTSKSKSKSKSKKSVIPEVEVKIEVEKIEVEPVVVQTMVNSLKSEKKTIKKVEGPKIENLKPEVDNSKDTDTDQWISANKKVNKKKPKTQQNDPQNLANIVKPVEPVKEAQVQAESPKSVKVKNVKPSDAVIVETSDNKKIVFEDKKVEKSIKSVKSSTPAEIPQAIQELMNAQLKAPNSIAAAIIEQYKNDNNNNIIESKKVEEATVTVTTSSTKRMETTNSNNNNSKKTTKSNNQILKTTNLTESMILIDNDTNSSGKANSTRTDSNPSSSESLQDLDVGDGWATITSKKKRTVRREV